MFKTGLFIFILCISSFSFSQNDSTDLILTTTPPTLTTQMDSIMFGDGGYEDYLLEFTISDSCQFW